MTKRYNLSKIMKRAWELVKATAMSISEALRKSWKEAKEMTFEQKIEKLENAGFNRWTKGGMDRMYINATRIGLECEYYKTGNIRDAWFNGENISNCRARVIKGAKTYIDLKTFEVYSDNEDLKANALKLMNAVIA